MKNFNSKKVYAMADQYNHISYFAFGRLDKNYAETKLGLFCIDEQEFGLDSDWEAKAKLEARH